MVKLVLGLGSNVGRRAVLLKKAVDKICSYPGVSFLELSPVYETEPWGFKEQKKFLNCVLVCRCSLGAEELLKIFKETEKLLGRVHRGKWQAREIDIDILFYGKRVIKKGRLAVPHPFIQERNFVLKPLDDVMPGFMHPVLKRTIRYLLKHSPDTGKLKLFSQEL